MMNKNLRSAVSALLLTVLLLAAHPGAHAQIDTVNDRHAAKKGGARQVTAATAVTGGGSAGQVAKWTSAATIGDSGISEDKFGKVGIGTNAPTSKLTVQGTIETTSGGVKFPDGSVQTTAFSAMSSPPLQPFANQLSATFPFGAAGTTAMFTVPAGKRLVIETVSLRVTLPFGQIVESFTITTSVNGQVIDSSLFPSPIPQSGSASISGVTQPLKIYADAGTQVIAGILRGFAAADGAFTLAISGYLVDA